MHPLLAIPPFPGARAPVFAVPSRLASELDEADIGALLTAMAQHRVGGCYWGRKVAGPELLEDSNWAPDADPWTLLETAREVRLPANDPRALLVLAAGRPLTLLDAAGRCVPVNAAALVHTHLASWQWHDPFSGRVISARQAIELCGLWRLIIDANRPIGAALGFAFWKRPTVAPLLWNGGENPFRRALSVCRENDATAVWRSRLTPAQEQSLEGRTVFEVEDGFIRSSGLGANCVPPLSIIVDRVGIHFDPTAPSELEQILQTWQFQPELLERAATLRAAIIANGLSKYEKGGTGRLSRPGGMRRHVLVPGQVEDDRAVTSGGALASNLELLGRVRAEVGRDAFIIYKPHPDVLAGHRKGGIAAQDIGDLADLIETRAPMADLIAMVDEVHVNSSLAGFEALIHAKPVTVHGVPFYAGWGLTCDRGPVPGRRTARRSIEELIAAAYIIYPRYLDPVTGLPCPVEVLVERLVATPPRLNLKARALVAFRQVSGRARRLLGSQ